MAIAGRAPLETKGPETSLPRSGAHPARGAGFGAIREPRIFLARAIRIVAHFLQAKRHFAPSALQIEARRAIRHPAVDAHLHVGAGARLADVPRERAQSMAREDGERLGRR